MTIKLIKFALIFGIACNFSYATLLPHGLTNNDIQKIIRVLGGSAAIRSMRSAETYEFWPGVRLGFELGIVPTGDLNGLGNADGNLPSLNPFPRLHVVKSLLFGIELGFEYLPANVINTLNTAGFMVKWMFYDEGAGLMSSSTYVGVTSITALDSQFKGTDIEAGIIVSQDYVRVRPYFGGGFIYGAGKVLKGLTIDGLDSASRMMIHMFVGAEFQLPMIFSVQIDVVDFYPSGSVLVGYKF